ncbi:MAG: flavin-containing monooxygenase [Rhodothalassiaceae bacterium]
MTPRIAIIGAGFAGIGLAIRLRQAGYRDLVLYERSDRPGGTWRDNIYPGCACDVPAHLYSFSFAPNPHWSRKYAPQPEIRAYIERCAREFGILPLIRFGHDLVEARFDAASARWQLGFAGGGSAEADILVIARGQLSEPKLPDIPGRDSFAGTSFHSARWQPGFDPAGKRIGVIGTGASAIQIVPALAREARALTVFQRSPPWIIPRRDHAYGHWRRRMFARVPGLRRLHRLRLYAQFELLYPGFSPGSLVARRVTALALGHLRAQVPDPGLRRQLRPDYPLGCKRILLSDDYYPALMRENVALVTTPIAHIAPAGVETVDGRLHALDALVHATGFAASDFLPGLVVSGPDGRDLRQCWRDGAEAYLGVMTAGFPNLFFLYGPNTNIGHNSILFMLECQIRLITRLLDGLVRRRARTVAVRAAAMRRFNEEIAARLARGVWAAACGNWYRNEQGRITNNWPGSTLEYRWRLARPGRDAFVYDMASSGAAPRRREEEMVDARA